MSYMEEIAQQHYAALPNGWCKLRVKFVASVQTSSVDKVANPDEIPVRLCNYTDVYYRDRITSDLQMMEGTASPEEIRKFRLRRGQVLITKDSEGWDDIGIPALVAEDIPDAVCGYHLAIFTPTEEKLDGAYLAWLCRADSLNDQFKLSANGVTRFGLGQYAMKNAVISVPPIAVQQRIAAFLDEKTAQIDALIEKKQQLLERLAEKRQAIITQAVTKGLNPSAPMKDSGVDWLGQIPAQWKKGNIRRFATMKTGHTPSRTEPEYWEDCSIPWFTLADVWQLRDGTRLYIEETAEKISPLGLANSAAELLPAGTVIFSRTASIGFSGIMPYPMATTQDFWNWICGPKLLPEYLLFLFRAMTQKFAEITNGSTHKTIYQPIAAGLEICVPPLKEQDEIVGAVKTSVRQIDQLRHKVSSSISHLTEYRSSLITAAVTGQIKDMP